MIRRIIRYLFSPYSAGERRLMEMLIALDHKLTLKLEKIMSAEDDLNAALGNISTAVAAAVTEIQTLATQLTNSPEDAQIEEAATRLNALASSLTAAIPAPAPAPTPAAA